MRLSLSRLARSRRAPLAAAGTVGLLSAALVAAAVMVPTRADAIRHLRLLRSFPAKDTVMLASPDSIRLWLSEPPELATTTVTLRNGAGRPMTLGKLTGRKAKGSPVSAEVSRPLPPGQYRVSWRTMSRDGHVVRDSFPFSVRAAK